MLNLEVALTAVSKLVDGAVGAAIGKVQPKVRFVIPIVHLHWRVLSAYDPAHAKLSITPEKFFDVLIELTKLTDFL